MMKKMIYMHSALNLSVILALIFCLTLIACVDDADLAKLFQERGVEGTIIISSLDGKFSYIHNADRSHRRFVPASTFKILNTLIALQEGAIKNEKDVIKWDKEDKGLEAWNQDQTLETAFPSSCIWYYQGLARRIGNEKYLNHLKQVGYGNEKTGPDITTFWLEGNLMISPQEQINFLEKLYSEKLPYEKPHMQLVKRLMIVEDQLRYIIRAKTGWARGINPQQGWYVGYVETNGQVWFFATNLETRKKGDDAFRKEITMGALKAKGII
jgi:beta-lactamase class D